MADVASVDIPGAQEPLVVVGDVVELVVVGLVVVPVVGEVLALLELMPLSPCPLELLEPSDPEPVVVLCCELPLLPLGCVDPLEVGVVEVGAPPLLGEAWLGVCPPVLGDCSEGLGCAGAVDGGGDPEPWVEPGWPG